MGGRAFPSYVALTADGQTLVGEPARRQMTVNPEGTATAFKRLMGLREKVRLRNRECSPEELSGFLLQKIKRDAEAFLGEPVAQAVVTVPAYFNDNQRNATKDAARIAGLEAVRLVNEPTAASLAYGLDRLGQELRIAVVDFGGGTLDVTIMEFGKGVFEVKATAGNTRLGGTDMDKLMFEHLVDRFRARTGVDVRSDPMAAARIKEAGEVAKIELSTSMTTHITLPFLAGGPSGPLHLDYELTRTELERIVRPVVERCREPVLQAFHDANIEPNRIDRLVFVGGPTRMPMVRAFFEELVGYKGETGVDPMECVAQGAAIQAGVLAGEVGAIVLVDVTPLTLGIETLGGVATPLIARNTPIRSSGPRSSRRRPTCRRASPCTCSRVNGQWHSTIQALDNSTWMDYPQRRVACRRSRLPSISMRTEFSTRPPRTWQARDRSRSASRGQAASRRRKSSA